MNEEILKIEWSYSAKPTPEQHAMIRAFSKLDRTELEDDGTIPYWLRTVYITISQALSVGLKFEVVERTGTCAYPLGLAETFRHADTAPVNNKCNVIVAGNHTLFEIDQVENFDNMCTDSLQNHLNNGWRILAICVQPDQRRPDYILGRNSNSPV